jgi:hypothetical protein
MGVGNLPRVLLLELALKDADALLHLLQLLQQRLIRRSGGVVLAPIFGVSEADAERRCGERRNHAPPLRGGSCMRCRGGQGKVGGEWFRR